MDQGTDFFCFVFLSTAYSNVFFSSLLSDALHKHVLNGCQTIAKELNNCHNTNTVFKQSFVTSKVKLFLFLPFFSGQRTLCFVFLTYKKRHLKKMLLRELSCLLASHHHHHSLFSYNRTPCRVLILTWHTFLSKATFK